MCSTVSFGTSTNVSLHYIFVKYTTNYFMKFMQNKIQDDFSFRKFDVLCTSILFNINGMEVKYSGICENTPVSHLTAHV